MPDYESYEVEITEEDVVESNMKEDQYSAEEIRANEARAEMVSESWTGAEVTLDTFDPEPSYEGDATPFASDSEMDKALNAETDQGLKRMDVDPEYAEKVQARIDAGMAVNEWGMTEQNPGAAKVAKARRLAAERQLQARKDAVSNDNLKVGPRSEGHQDQPQPFESEDELVEAMGDKRYDSDKTYTRAVDARLAVTDWF